MSKLTTIVFAHLDKFQMTLYDDKGNKHEYKQGHSLVNKVMTPENLRELEINGKIEVDLTEGTVTSHFQQFEEKTNGLVKFFRIAKSKLKSIFEDQPVEGSFGNMPIAKHDKVLPGGGLAHTITDQNLLQNDAAAKQLNAVAEIMANAVPATDLAFHQNTAEADADKDTTIVAVVDGKDILPEAGELTKLVKHAVDNPTAAIGLQKFMERMAAVATTRRHSAEDLMKFLKTADLPFADNGDIIAYKNLKFPEGVAGGKTFVDIHSGNVTQKLGSLVHMEESMVDPSRSNDCSYGLHIASRSYLGGFSGPVTVVCRIRPEDVIAVPQYNNNKMRVCAYHIIDVLPVDMAQALLKNKPITSVEGGDERLARYIAGQHIGITNRVKIGGSKGSNLTITEEMAEAQVVEEIKKVEETPVENIEAAKIVEEVPPPNVGKEVDFTAIAKQTAKVKAESHREKIARLFKETPFTKVQADQIRAIKKASKKSWSVLGVDDKQVKLLGKHE